MKKADPAREVFTIDCQVCVRWKWASVIRVFFEQNCLPEAIHLLQVFRPTILYTFVENVPQKFILTYLPVKRVYHEANVIYIGYVVFLIHVLFLIRYCNSKLHNKPPTL